MALEVFMDGKKVNPKDYTFSPDYTSGTSGNPSGVLTFKKPLTASSASTVTITGTFSAAGMWARGFRYTGMDETPWDDAPPEIRKALDEAYEECLKVAR